MKPHAASDPGPDRREQDAFTFTDLLVVLGVVTVLALLTLTAMAHSQPSSDRAGCANNLRRLMQAWQMYADDNTGRLMGNYSPTPGSAWVSGNLDYSPANSDNTNTAKLTTPAFAQIGPYVNSSSLFRCPADAAALVVGGVPTLRVRSYSMNAYVGPNSDLPLSPTYQMMTKLVEVSQPDRVFVLLEEHPGSLNDSVFLLDLTRVGLSALIIDYPGHFHLGGANLGMADGHVEHWQWSDARTMPPMNGAPLALNVSSPNNPDVARIQAAASYPK